MSNANHHPVPVTAASSQEKSALSVSSPLWTVKALCKQCLPEAGHSVVNPLFSSTRVPLYSPWYQHRLSSMRVWDPACGNGEIAEHLGQFFREVEASDLHAEGMSRHIDFFGISERPFGVDFIISRPPEDQAMEFCRKARSFAYEGAALLIPMNKLAEITVPISKIASMYLEGFAPVAICPIHEDPVLKTDGSGFAWVIWSGTKYPEEVPGRLTPLDIHEHMWNPDPRT